MMDKHEELSRALKDRDICESEARYLTEEIQRLEILYPENYEDLEEWNKLDREINNLDNEASYLTSVIEDLMEDE